MKKPCNYFQSAMSPLDHNQSEPRHILAAFTAILTTRLIGLTVLINHLINMLKLIGLNRFLLCGSLWLERRVLVGLAWETFFGNWFGIFGKYVSYRDDVFVKKNCKIIIQVIPYEDHREIQNHIFSTISSDVNTLLTK